MNTPLLLTLLLFVWAAECAVRMYAQARYFQIEEYQAARFARWWLGARERLFPRRALAGFVIGAVLPFMLGEAPGSAFPYAVAGLCAVVACWPARPVEVKKAFRATPRARRILGTSWALLALATAGAAALTGGASSGSGRLALAGVSMAHAAGFALFTAAPLFLMAGNLLMTPVEGAIRRMYLRQAARILKDLNPVVIGITGSYGKTSTKTYLAHLLGTRYRTYPTPKSYNTLMGISTAVNRDLADDRSVEYFIAEMGAYIPGEIERICSLARPALSIVTEVGPQHLERFRTLENIAIAKYEIVRALPPDGTAVFNWDNPYVRAMMARGYPATRIGISQRGPAVEPADDGTAPRFVAEAISETLAGLHFTVVDRETGERATYHTPLPGLHNVTNLLCAIAVCVHEGMTLSDLVGPMRTLQPAESRLARSTTASGAVLLNDAYSANPAGAQTALRTLSLYTTGRRVLVTPGMVELAELMEPENRRLGVSAAAVATDVILVGEAQTAPIRAGLSEAGFPTDRLHIVEHVTDAIAWADRNLTAADAVLFMNDLPDTYLRK
jgi:UDP-N-acetylmuramoyl-tripeptide--D-alanyl-D-alanine ligase